MSLFSNAQMDVNGSLETHDSLSPDRRKLFSKQKKIEESDRRVICCEGNPNVTPDNLMI